MILNRMGVFVAYVSCGVTLVGRRGQTRPVVLTDIPQMAAGFSLRPIAAPARRPLAGNPKPSQIWLNPAAIWGMSAIIV